MKITWNTSLFLSNMYVYMYMYLWMYMSLIPILISLSLSFYAQLSSLPNPLSSPPSLSLLSSLSLPPLLPLPPSLPSFLALSTILPSSCRCRWVEIHCRFPVLPTQPSCATLPLSTRSLLSTSSSLVTLCLSQQSLSGPEPPSWMHLTWVNL